MTGTEAAPLRDSWRRVWSLVAGGLLIVVGVSGAAGQGAGREERVTIPSHGWELVGDLRVPAVPSAAPAALLLHRAAGDRTEYEILAEHLARRGIVSLRIDLRGHGESTNRGAFVPGERPRDPLIWDAEIDVRAAYDFLRARSDIDADRMAVVGGSYSGEEMAEAGRLGGYAHAYVVLSPGSFSDASIDGIDGSGVPWLFVAANRDQFLQEITAAVRERSVSVEMVVTPGTSHATELLDTHPDLAERIAVWLDGKLH